MGQLHQQVDRLGKLTTDLLDLSRLDAGAIELQTDETDLSHVLMALAHGLATQEVAGWLGTSAESRDRRWALAFQAVLDGAAPAGGGPPARQGSSS